MSRSRDAAAAKDHERCLPLPLVRRKSTSAGPQWQSRRKRKRNRSRARRKRVRVSGGVHECSGQTSGHVAVNTSASEKREATRQQHEAAYDAEAVVDERVLEARAEARLAQAALRRLRTKSIARVTVTVALTSPSPDRSIDRLQSHRSICEIRATHRRIRLSALASHLITPIITDLRSCERASRATT